MQEILKSFTGEMRHIPVLCWSWIMSRQPLWEHVPHFTPDWICRISDVPGQREVRGYFLLPLLGGNAFFFFLHILWINLKLYLLLKFCKLECFKGQILIYYFLITRAHLNSNVTWCRLFKYKHQQCFVISIKEKIPMEKNYNNFLIIFSGPQQQHWKE